jgi:uncharacterized damage-inducible protein DinB
MITLERLFKHMAWANQQVFGKICELEEKALQAFIADPNLSVGEILFHITDAAGSYIYRLTEITTPELSAPKNMKELFDLRAKQAGYDAKLLTLAEVAGADIIVKRVEGDLKRKRSTVLSQAIHHATEHRAQVTCALDFVGYKTVNLDDYDLWSYEHLNS